MTREVYRVTSEGQRDTAVRAINEAPLGFTLEVRRNKRTTAQSDRMWAMLTEVSRQVEWHGVRLSADDWKLVFMSALNQEMRIVPNIAGNGFVNLGRSSSSLTVGEMSDMIELIFAFGAERGVVFREPKQPQSAA